MLPDILTAGKTKRETRWYALREHIHIGVSDELDSRDLGCFEAHWTTIRKLFRRQGIHYPRQLVLDRRAEQTEWIVPTYMSSNPGWLKPL